jgi:hypothetical protein
MHAGYRSAADVVFVFGVGLLFGKLVDWGGSILGVSLAHGLTNVILLVVMPYSVDTFAETITITTPWVMVLGAVLAGVGIVLLWRHNGVARRPAPVVPVTANVRSLRQAAQLTYVELAQRSGLPARVIAEIEHGWRRPEPEALCLIMQALGNKA